MLAERSSSSFMPSSMEISLWSFATSSSLAPSSCLLTADIWKAAVRRGIGAAHGWNAAAGRNDCGRTALVEKRAAERGALRARVRRESIVLSDCIQVEQHYITTSGKWQCDKVGAMAGG